MGTNRINFTDDRVARLTAAGMVWDEKTPHLAVRVQPSGRASFVYYRKHGGKPVKRSIGSIGSMTVAAARARAMAYSLALHEGRSLDAAEPAAPATPDVRSLGMVFAEYIDAVKGRKRTWEADVAMFDRFLKPHADIAFDAIDRAFVKARYLEVRDGKIPRKWSGGKAPEGFKQRPTPMQAARFVTLLGSIIKWEWDRREDSGFTGTRPERPTKGLLGRMGHRENKIESPLPESEFMAIVAAIDEHEAAGGNRVRCDALRLMAWTGLRSGNVKAMRWEWVKLDGPRPFVEIPADDFKGKRQHVVPLIPQAVALLMKWRATGGDYVLPGRAAGGHVGDLRPSWEKVLKIAGLADRRPRVRMHDVRGHTATKLHRLGVPIATIMAVMGWKNVQTAMRYIRASRDESFAAMEKYAAAWGQDRKAESA